MERDNLATLFMQNKGKSMHNFGQQTVRNSTNLNSLEKFILLEDGNMGNFYPEIDIYGSHIYSKFNDHPTTPVYDIYNMYNISNGMRIFIPKSYSKKYARDLIYNITFAGPEIFGYVAFSDTYVPNYLSYNDKYMLSQYI
jgi:hypothetical protein